MCIYAMSKFRVHDIVDRPTDRYTFINKVLIKPIHCVRSRMLRQKTRISFLFNNKTRRQIRPMVEEQTESSEMKRQCDYGY